MSSGNKDFVTQFKEELESSIRVKKCVIEDHVSQLGEIVQVLIDALQAGNKILFFGNGGSAADSQHIAAELVSKYKLDRRPLAAIALTTDTSILTSTGNDFGFEDIFVRQIQALGQKGDVAFGISTSGNSANVLNAVRAANNKGLTTIGFTGKKGGQLKNLVDHCFQAPSDSTPRIQEVHITVAHVMCDILEQQLCRANKLEAQMPPEI